MADQFVTSLGGRRSSAPVGRDAGLHALVIMIPVAVVFRSLAADQHVDDHPVSRPSSLFPSLAARWLTRPWQIVKEEDRQCAIVVAGVWMLAP